MFKNYMKWKLNTGEHYILYVGNHSWKKMFANSLWFSHSRENICDLSYWKISEKWGRFHNWPLFANWALISFQFCLKRVLLCCTYHVTFTYHVQIRAIFVMTSQEFHYASCKPACTYFQTELKCDWCTQNSWTFSSANDFQYTVLFRSLSIERDLAKISIDIKTKIMKHPLLRFRSHLNSTACKQ